MSSWHPCSDAFHSWNTAWLDVNSACRAITSRHCWKHGKPWKKHKKNNEHHLKSCLRGVRQSYQSYGRSSTWSAGIIHTHLHKSYFPYGQQTVSSGILWILGSSGCFHLLWTNPILEVSRVVDGLMMAETIEFHKDVKPHHEWLARGPQEACTCYVYLWVAIGKVQGDVLLMFLWIDFE